jgi:RNA polymerase sigma-70 factor (ECF subfamily)
VEHDHPDRRTPLTDELLAIRCQLGEAEAFAELVERWHAPLHQYLRRMTSFDDAADLIQDVWLRVLRAMPGLRDPARLRAWLFGIARRTVMDRLRRRYAGPTEVPVDEAELPAPAADEGIEDLLDVHAALDRMPLLEREALTLFYLRALSLEQIAELLDIPTGTVKSRLYRARQVLRHQLIAREQS